MRKLIDQLRRTLAVELLCWAVKVHTHATLNMMYALVRSHKTGKLDKEDLRRALQ